MQNQPHRGFTLIELIVVIAIIAILVTIVVLAINPAEQLARSRDAKRVADLDTLRAAVNLYLAQATGTTALYKTSADECVGNTATTSDDTYFTSATSTRARPTNFGATSTGSLSVGSGGWAPARMDQTPGGAPLSNLPADPTNDGVQKVYGYACGVSPTRYEFTASLESSYFREDLDLDGKDGGNSTSTYEVGTSLTLIPADY